MENVPFKVVYNSDLIIRDRFETASLCVFYGKVLLPYTTDETSGRLMGTVSSSYHRPDIRNWEIEHATLFEEGVLERLGPPPIRTQEIEVPILAEQTLILRPDGVPDDAIEPTMGPRSAGRLVGIPELSVTPRWEELQPGDRIVSRQTERITLYSPSRGYIDRSREKVIVQRKVATDKVQSEIRVSQEKLSSIFSMPVRTIRVGDAKFIAEDLAKHLARVDVDVPQIFTTLKGQPWPSHWMTILNAAQEAASMGHKNVRNSL
jgi:hypothetical protein